MIISIIIFITSCMSETLLYDLNFAGIPAGESTLSMSLNNDIILNSKTKTNKAFSKLLKFQ